MLITNFRSVALAFVLFASVNFAQTIDSLTVSITSVRAGTIELDKSGWENISINNSLPLSLSFENSIKINKKIFYKVFLDGHLLEANLSEKFLLLKELNVGTHLLKIVPATSIEKEGIPLLLTITVTDEKPVVIKVNEPAAPGLESNLYLSYILGAVVIIQFFIIIFLFLRKKKKNDPHKKEKGVKITNSQAQDHALQELISLKQTLTRLQDELKEQQETNEYLQKQLKEVNTNVLDLERANLHLIDQKEKLEESKYKIEVLHSQKEDMFAMVVHDIKNPASAIQGYIQLLNSYDLNANEQHEIMESLVATSGDIVKMSQDMCSILAKAMPEPTLIFSSNSINDVIETVVNQNVSYSKTKKVKLIKNTSGNLPKIKIDAEKIEEALDNLLNNAIKFAPPDTTVEITSYFKDDKKKTVVVSVKDNGVGLSEEDLKYSFQKGAVLSAKPTGLEKSSGLGLWIVKKIIEEHNGKVWVESKLGEGSTFAFEIPIEE
ncbi:MAG: HAMP domain-containing sensor histidine kinase [Ignavibacteriaceae bacterium]|jgi:signal transduction histidine kinase